MNIDERVLDLLVEWETQVAAGAETAVESLAGDDPALAENLKRYVDSLQATSWLARLDEQQAKLSLPSGASLSCALILPEGLELRKFQSQLLKANILEPEEITRVVSRPEIKTAYQLSAALLDAGLVTKFQLRAVAHGRTRGLRLGRYVVLDRIGAGGMGQVFRARHSRMQREVALKVLPRESMSKPQVVERFLREVQAAASVVHRNIVTAYDADEAEGLHFLVMEYVVGQDLSTLVRQGGPLRVPQAVDYLTQAAQGLQYAHGQGLIHRDIKPANLLVDTEGVVKILDMGIARFEQRGGQSNPELTQEGSAMGTVDYMPPEQAIDSKSVDVRADLYSLGCTLHYLLTGKPPFGGDTMMVKLLGHREAAPPDLSAVRRDVPRQLNEIFQKLLAKSPADRYAEAAELLAELEKVAPLVADHETRVGADIGQRTSESELDTSPTGFLQTISLVGLGNLLPGTKAGGGKASPRYAKPMLYGGVGIGLLMSLALLYFTMAAIRPPAAPPQDEVASNQEALPAEEAAAEPETEPAVEEAVAANTSETPPADTTDTLEAPVPPPEEPAWQPTPEQQAFFDVVIALPVDRQAEAVAQKLQEVNPGFDGQFQQKIADEKVTEFEISTIEVTDIWPVRALADLQLLRCAGTDDTRGKLADLSPLKGMPLIGLNIDHNQVEDLSPLAGMPLSRIWFGANQVSDLSPLADMKLQIINAWGNKYSDLSPLDGAPLTYVNCAVSMVSDLSPLSNSSTLSVIDLNTTRVMNLEPLRNLPIRKLICTGTLIADSDPFLSLPLNELGVQILLFHSPDHILIRRLPVRQLGMSYIEIHPEAEFWKQFEDRRSAAEQFAAETSQLPPDQQVAQIESKLAELNPNDDISLTVTINGEAIESAVVRLASRSTDITPLRALSQLKQLTIGSGRPWLDLSPLNSLPLEHLICTQDQAMRNRLMLAEIETLQTINGQPKDTYLAYLKALSDPPTPQQPEFIPTEEELLAAHPPLDQWLEDREILTVAQDGSAMFTTIQEALDAQEDGQVVQVLDKGPYRESLHWANKANCGLISQVGTIIETVEWKGYYDNHKESQRFQSLVDCRLSGLTFAYSPQDENENTPLRFTGTVNLCIEDCVVIPSGPVPHNCNPRIEVVNTLSQRRIGTACVRNCVLVISHLQYAQRGEAEADEKDQPSWLAIHNNWVHRGDTVSGSYNYHGVYINHNTDQSFVAVVRDNVFTRGTVDMGHHFINSKAMGLSYHNNSVAGSKGGLFANSVGNFRFCEFENNLNLVQHHDVLFSPNAVLFLPVARQRWQLSGNFSNGRHREGDTFLSLSEPHPTEMRLLSNEPLHRDFMRVDPTTIQVPEGQPFPGALPPGPAPEDGDWFTRLQERFEEALEYLPEEERKVWTRPVELPPFSPPDETDQAEVDAAAAAPGGAEPTILTRLENRNTSFLEYDGPQPRRWVEVDQEGKVKFTFEELRRTDRLVTIIDRRRNMTIRLPLGGGRVLFSTDGEEKWSALGNFQVSQAPEEMIEEENDPMANGNLAAAPVAGNANRPNGQAARIDRVQLPKGMRDILKLPGMSEKMDRLERDYLRHQSGFFIYGRVTPQNPQVDARLIEARMPVGPGGHFIDLVADAGRPVGFVLHGHEYLSVVPTGPPNDHQGLFAEDLGELVMVPLRSAETKSTVLEIERMDLRGRRQPVSVNFRITTEVPDVNYFTETIVPRGSEDMEGFSIQGQTLANGKFSLKGLSPLPTKYRLRIDAPGHLPLNETLGLNRSTERFVIEEKIPIRIETILRKDGKFDLANVQEAWLYGGDYWQFNSQTPEPVPLGAPRMGAMRLVGGGTPFMNGSGGAILQANRVLTFALSGMTSSAKDLGEGTLQQFLDQDPTKTMTYRDRDFQITPGHVYLLRSYYTAGMNFVPGQQEGYEMQNSDYALVRVTLQ